MSIGHVRLFFEDDDQLFTSQTTFCYGLFYGWDSSVTFTAAFTLKPLIQISGFHLLEIPVEEFLPSSHDEIRHIVSIHL